MRPPHNPALESSEFFALLNWSHIRINARAALFLGLPLFVYWRPVCSGKHFCQVAHACEIVAWECGPR